MTTSPISYNVAQNIFKYLDVEKRLQISIQCPELRTAERKADLQLHTLTLNEKDLYIHNILFDLLKNRGGQDGTFMQIGGFWTVKKKFEVTGHKAFFEKTLNLHFADRGRVRIDTLLCRQANLISEYLPEDLKIDCGTLYTGKDQLDIFQNICPYINLVEYLPIFVGKPEDPILDGELIRKATKLMIRTESDESLINDLLKLRNPTIEFQHVTSQNPFSAGDVMTIVKDWMTRCPPVATMFIWETRNEKLIEVVMDELRKELGAVSKSGWPDSKINDAVLLMSSGHWLRINAELKLIRMEVREKDSY